MKNRESGKDHSPKPQYFLLMLLCIEWMLFLVTLISWGIGWLGPRGHMPSVEGLLFLVSAFGVAIVGVINLICFAMISGQRIKLHARLLLLSLSILPVFVSFLLSGFW